MEGGGVPEEPLLVGPLHFQSRRTGDRLYWASKAYSKSPTTNLKWTTWNCIHRKSAGCGGQVRFWNRLDSIWTAADEKGDAVQHIGYCSDVSSEELHKDILPMDELRSAAMRQFYDLGPKWTAVHTAHWVDKLFLMALDSNSYRKYCAKNSEKSPKERAQSYKRVVRQKFKVDLASATLSKKVIPTQPEDIPTPRVKTEPAEQEPLHTPSDWTPAKKRSANTSLGAPRKIRLEVSPAKGPSKALLSAFSFPPSAQVAVSAITRVVKEEEPDDATPPPKILTLEEALTFHVPRVIDKFRDTPLTLPELL